MTELNPYESPKIPPSKQLPTSAAKKAVGFMTLAILTPIAVIIAGSVSCLGVFPAVAAVGNRLGEHSYLLMFIAGWAVFLVPPITVLIVMGRWAITAYNHEVEEHNKKLKQMRLEPWKPPFQD